MSETLSQDPDGLNVAYTTLAPSYPPTPATPSSTVQDAPPGANLPPFSTFSADMDTTGSFGSVPDRLFGDTRLLDISSWDYYTDGRLLDRSEISSQPQYRPWESKPVDPTSSTGFAPTTPVNTFADAFAHQNGVSKLPSFQSQFQTFSDTVTTSEPTTLTTLTNLTPVSPNSSSSPGSHSLTTLNSNFHTLSAVNPRSYPLVPAPIQAREIPSIQQQFLDERHIQLYSHPTANLATLNNTIHSASIFPAQNGATIIQNNHQLIQSPATVVTVLKSDADLKLTTNHHLIDPTMKTIQNVGLHPTQFQNPMTTLNAVAGADSGLYNGLDKKLNGLSAASMINSPTRNDFRKKERRKIRASSLESSAESDGASSNNNMEIGSENSGQVAAVSSTAGYKSHHSMGVNSSMDMDEISGGNVDKQVKKKRKRCGECIGCQRKDNCGDCAPCRNDKSHQICKQRRCEKLTEKKNLYGDGTYIRGESRRGRGKGRGGGSYRGRKASSAVAASLSSSNSNSVGVNPPETNGGSGSGGSSSGISANQPPPRPSPQPPPPPPTVTTATVQQPMPVQQQPMTPMPFYADPNRFPAPVWQTEAPQVAWAPQGQFIQQIPTATAQPTLETYQQYPNGIYQATYQQPAFETNTFYTGAVQVLTRPPSTPNQSTQQQQQQQQQQQLTPRGNYTASSPSQSNNNQNRSQYQEFQNFIPPATTPSSTDANQSRPSSVNSNMNPPTPNNQTFQQQNSQQQQNAAVFTTVSTATFSPTSNQTNYVNANSGNSGNAEPGYPQVNSNPQLDSHNSSGYPGSGQYNSGPNDWQQSNDNQQQIMQWEQQNDDSAKRYQNSSEAMHNNVQNEKVFSQSDKVNLNTRIKTMILSKQQQQQQQQEGNVEDENKSNVEQNPTGHFLWFSHHHHLDENRSGDGGPLHHSPKQHAIITQENRRLAKDEKKIDSANQRSENITDETSQKSPDSSSSCAVSHACICSKEMHFVKGSQSHLLGCSENLQNLKDNLESKLRFCLRADSCRWRIVTEANSKSHQIDKQIFKASTNQEPLILVLHHENHSCIKRYQIISIIFEESHLSSAIKTESLFSILSENLLSSDGKYDFTFSFNSWSKTAEELFAEEKIQELANTWLVPLLKSLGFRNQGFNKVSAVSEGAELDYPGFLLNDCGDEKDCKGIEVQNGQITSTTTTTQDHQRSTGDLSSCINNYPFSVVMDTKGIVLDLVHDQIRAKIILKNHNPRQSPEHISLIFQ